MSEDSKQSQQGQNCTPEAREARKIVKWLGGVNLFPSTHVDDTKKPKKLQSLLVKENLSIEGLIGLGNGLFYMTREIKRRLVELMNNKLLPAGDVHISGKQNYDTNFNAATMEALYKKSVEIVHQDKNYETIRKLFGLFRDSQACQLKNPQLNLLRLLAVDQLTEIPPVLFTKGRRQGKSLYWMTIRVSGQVQLKKPVGEGQSMETIRAQFKCALEHILAIHTRDCKWACCVAVAPISACAKFKKAGEQYPGPWGGVIGPVLTSSDPRLCNINKHKSVYARCTLTVLAPGCEGVHPVLQAIDFPWTTTILEFFCDKKTVTQILEHKQSTVKRAVASRYIDMLHKWITGEQPLAREEVLDAFMAIVTKRCLVYAVNAASELCADDDHFVWPDKGVVEEYNKLDTPKEQLKFWQELVLKDRPKLAGYPKLVSKTRLEHKTHDVRMALVHMMALKDVAQRVLKTLRMHKMLLPNGNVKPEAVPLVPEIIFMAYAMRKPAHGQRSKQL